MPNQVLKTGAGAVIALSVLAGCSLHQAANDQVSPAHPPGYEAHNSADVTYAQRMIPLQQRAITLSDVLLAKRDVDSYVTDVATAIKRNDGSEIAQMQGWLKGWGGQQPATAGDDIATLGADQALADLKSADDGAAAQIFLRQMIANRQQALALSKTEIDDGQYRATIAVARGNQVTEQRQITTMQSLLTSP